MAVVVVLFMFSDLVIDAHFGHIFCGDKVCRWKLTLCLRIRPLRHHQRREGGLGS